MLAEVDSSQKCRVSVHHDHLLMVAVKEASQEMSLPVGNPELYAAFAHGFHHPLRGVIFPADFSGENIPGDDKNIADNHQGEMVDEHSNPQPLPGLANEYFGKSFPDTVSFERKHLEINGAAGGKKR